jgi:hypothetical protein
MDVKTNFYSLANLGKVLVCPNSNLRVFLIKPKQNPELFNFLFGEDGNKIMKSLDEDCFNFVVTFEGFEQPSVMVFLKDAVNIDCDYLSDCVIEFVENKIRGLKKNQQEAPNPVWFEKFDDDKPLLKHSLQLACSEFSPELV